MKKTQKLKPAQLESVARLFAALAEPSRLCLLQNLRQGPRTVNELVKKCRLKQANVSKQLAILYDAHLVARRRSGNLVHYQISDPIVFALCDRVCAKVSKDAKRQGIHWR